MEEEQEQAILRLHEQGIGVAQIAEQLHVKERHVLSVIGGVKRGVPRATHGVVGGAYMLAGCTCEPCTTARAASVEEFKKDNAKSAEAAHRKNSIWTTADMEILARTDLTARQVAAMLGRSISAVNSARFKMRTDPEWAQGHSLDSGTAPRRTKPSTKDIAIMVDRSYTADAASKKTGFSVKTVNNYRAKEKLARELKVEQ
jgi:hypothetical protein